MLRLCYAKTIQRIDVKAQFDNRYNFVNNHLSNVALAIKKV